MALPIDVDPEIMNGVPVFSGTRVPVETLFEYLMKGSNTRVFMECFPTVEPKHVQLVLDYCWRKIVKDVGSVGRD